MSVSAAWAGGIAGAAAIAAGGWVTYAAMSPGSQLFGRTLVAGRDPREVALTYDDGPNDAATPKLLEILARAEVRATFFMIGRFVRERPDLVRAVAAAGHLVGNHTMTHPWLMSKPAALIRDELRACQEALEDVLGAPVRYFRAPHGARRPAVLRAAAELGLTPVQWNVTAGDWSAQSEDALVQVVERGVGRLARRGRGANVLLHDGFDQHMGTDRGKTLRATERLLARFGAEGKRLVTVDAWG